MLFKAMTRLALPLVLALSGCLNQPAPEAASRSEVIKVTSTVQAIDYDKRIVTLKEEDGTSSTVTVSEEVTNLPQVKVGDTVTVELYTGLAAMLKPKGSAQSPDVQVDLGAAKAAAGDRPGLLVANAVTADVRVESVDVKNNKIRVTGPSGLVRELDVMHPDFQAMLKGLKPGDIVEMTYFEAFAVSVEPAAAAKTETTGKSY
jgi:Cu/Ag efflux protein CusF